MENNLIDKNNNHMKKNSWTKNTTWYKWFFTDVEKMAILIAAISFHVYILCKHAYREMDFWTAAFFEFLISIGTILIIVSSIIQWNKEKKLHEDQPLV